MADGTVDRLADLGPSTLVAFAAADLAGSTVNWPPINRGASRCRPL